MAIRVTQNTMYNNMVGNMQKNLGAYMESITQGSTQKKINRPSDDPAGTYRVLTTRQNMTSTDQYQENVDTAKGWLNLADSVLSSNVTTALTGLKTLAEQASTGHYTAEQRMIMADQARQYFGQLLNLSNTQFEDMHLFAGHKYDQPAFQMGLGVTSWDENWAAAVNQGDIKVTGSSERTVMIQFTGEGKDGTLEGATYRWSNDGGATWHEDMVVIEPDENGEDRYLLKPSGSGVVMTIGKDTMVPNPDFNENEPESDTNPSKINLSVVPAVTEDGPGANNGTLLYIRPTAMYMGDDADPPAELSIMGAGNIDKDAIRAEGTFGSNVLVRVDGQRGSDGSMESVDLAKAGQEFYWSYSTDGGSTWVTAKGITTGDDIRMPIPGGYLDISADAGELAAGAQILVHPYRANLDYEIMKDTYLSVNSVGKDVFGGYYNGKPAMSDSDENLFEVVGSFIGYLEGNNQEGCQKTLAALEKAEKKVLAEATRIGGMENRLEMAADVLSFQKLDQQERLSYVEDIDLTELLTKLTRQQLSYQTVLQSSSMIMKMSLMNYI